MINGNLKPNKKQVCFRIHDKRKYFRHL